MRTIILTTVLAAGLCSCDTGEVRGEGGEADDLLGSDRLDARGDPAHRGEPTITGSLRLSGCVVAGDEMSVHADRLTLVTTDGSEVEERPTLVGEVMDTEDPHEFTFSIPGVEEGGSYRLSVDLRSDACGPLFLQSESEGIAIGGGEPVRIEGFAARTTVEILSTQSEELGEDLWVGRDHLDFLTREQATRRLRWRSDIDDVYAGELQISATPYPLGLEIDPCAEPADDGSGILYRETVPAEVGVWNEVDVDFGAIVADDVSRPTSLGRLLLAGSPLYVRVVPQLTSGAACEVSEHGVHGWVAVAKIPGVNVLPAEEPVDPPLVAGDGNAYLPPSVDPAFAGRPGYGEWGYTVVKDHVLPEIPCIGIYGAVLREQDPIGCMVLDNHPQKAGDTVFVGEKYVLVWKSSSGGGGGIPVLGNVVDVFTAAGTGLGKGVDQLSQLVESVKGALAGIGADFIDTLIPGACDAIESAGSSCEQLVKAGIETGLISMGMPPSLPNWEQLKEEGIDYVAAEIGSAIEKKTGIPSGLTEEVLRQLAEEVLDELGPNAGLPGKYHWVKPYINLYPATLRLTIERTDDTPIHPNLRIAGPPNEVYQGVDIAVPSLFPSSGRLTVPIQLQPRFDSMLVPLCKVTKYGVTTCAGMPGLSEPACFVEIWQGGETWGYEDWDCDWVNWDEVYYREGWLDRVADAGCVGFTLRSGIGGGQWFFVLDDAFALFSTVNASAPASWDGSFHWTSACE